MNYINHNNSLFIDNFSIDNPELKATRTGFAEALLDLGKENPNIVVLGGDVSPSVKTDMFRDKYPDRFFSVGISEQDMMGTAAGFALAGKIPFASTYGEFATGRPFDQIRQSIAYSRMNVKICASHCGLTVGPDGATHQSLEDVAIMRVLPHMNVVTPCDSNQTYKTIIECAKIDGPFYVRFYRDNSPNYTSSEAPFQIGKADTLIDGDDCTIIASGLLVWESIMAVEDLHKQGIKPRLVNMHTIKPIDREAIVNCAKETGCFVTAEDHQINCGLGSAVAEILAREYPAPIEFIGAKDTFGESGSGKELMDKYGLSKKYIVEAVKRAIKRKK
jgi:transketolase